MNQTSAPTLYTADLRINTSNLQVFKNKQLINISDLSYQVMMALINAAPNVVSSDELIDQAWQSVEVSQETLTQRIALLRKSLVGDSHDTYIQSVRNRGYRWIPEVTTKGNKQSTKLKMVSLSMMFLMLIAFAYQIGLKQLAKPRATKTVSAQVNVSDFTQQAWSYLDKHNAQSNQLAIGLFRQALVVSESDVNALTGLSIALSHEVTKFNQSAELLLEARNTARKATELDSSHAQAWAALAFVDDANGEIDTAIQGYEKAIALAPNNTSTISSLAYLYAVKGRVIDALRLNVSVLGSKQLYLDLQIAQSLNLLGFDVLAEQWFYKADVLAPDNVFATHQRAQFYLAKNNQLKATEVINQAQNRGIVRPELPTLLGLMTWKNGDLIAAYDHFKAAVSIDNGDMQSYLLMQSIASKNEQIKTQNHEWLSASLSWPDQAVYQAQYHAQTGQTGAAFEALERAVSLGYRDIEWLQWLPAFDSLKASPRWTTLITTMQTDVDKQRQLLLKADWLPTSFLDPKN